MGSSSNRSNSLACLCALFVAASFLLVYHASSGAVQVFSSRWVQPILDVFQPDQAPSFLDEDLLRERLEAVAFRNKTVIVATLNKSWAANNTMIDTFLASFRLGIGTAQLLEHLLIVNLDQAAHERCQEVHPHCFKLPTPGIDFSGEKVFMSADYLQMMWRRVDFLRHVLQLGYSFVFTDADIMWLRDPFVHFDPDADFEIACDRFNGNPTDLGNFPNGGFVHAVSNKRTIAFYKYWYSSRVYYPHRHDQDVFNYIKFSRQFRDLNLRTRFMDTKYFGGFCQVSRDLDEVCTMHANCCTKLERKLADLELVLDDWKRYRALSSQDRQRDSIFWRAPRECLHSWEH